MGSNDVTQKSGSRGTKIVRSSGVDNSSYDGNNKDNTMAGIANRRIKGDGYDISSSIEGGKVRKIP